MRRLNKKSPDAAQARLAKALAQEDRQIARAGWLTVLASAVWMLMAAAVASVFGALVAGPSDPRHLWSMAAVFVAAGGLRIALNLQAARMLDHAAERVLAKERAALLEAQDILTPRAERVASAAVAAMLTDKLPMLRPYILRYRPAALRAATIPLVFLLAASVFSWAVALILAVAGPLIPVFMALVGMAAREASERQMDEIGSLSDLLGERLAALTDIRLLDARDRMSAEFSDQAEGLRARTMAVLRVAFLSSTVLELFSALGVAMVAVYVGFALLGELSFGAGATPLTLAQGVFLLMLAPEFFQPLRDLAAAWHDKAAALAVSKDLTELETEQSSVILGRGGAARKPQHGPRVALCGVRLGALGFPDLTIEPGEALAFTGPSGSGKSTLISLIGGLEAPDCGQIRIDGTPLSASNADQWRAQVAWVPQTTHFLAGPLRNSLALGAQTRPTQDEFDEALGLAAATEVVARLPDGLHTPLGEFGGGVSGGEARRLMLASAALSGRPVVLADEPTADLDPQTAAVVIRALLSLKARGVTVIVATHDMALAQAMDRQVSLSAPELEGAA